MNINQLRGILATDVKTIILKSGKEMAAFKIAENYYNNNEKIGAAFFYAAAYGAAAEALRGLKKGTKVTIEQGFSTVIPKNEKYKEDRMQIIVQKASVVPAKTAAPAAEAAEALPDLPELEAM